MPVKKVAKKPEKTAAKKPPAKKTKKAVDEVREATQRECDHCQGVGKCTAGEPYDKGHHQMFGARVMMTSCVDCLEAAGEHRNSKKLVACRICGGTGKMET